MSWIGKRASTLFGERGETRNLIMLHKSLFENEAEISPISFSWILAKINYGYKIFPFP